MSFADADNTGSDKRSSSSSRRDLFDELPAGIDCGMFRDEEDESDVRRGL